MRILGKEKIKFTTIKYIKNLSTTTIKSFSTSLELPLNKDLINSTTNENKSNALEEFKESFINFSYKNNINYNQIAVCILHIKYYPNFIII
jgi:hypothetical protein